MKTSSILTTILIFLIHTSCNNQKVDDKSDTKITRKFHSDTAIINGNSDTLRNINNFDIKTYNNFIDNLNTSPQNDRIKITTKNNLCSGDNCTSYKTIKDLRTGTILYFFKSDAGEYGFSNDQFILNSDSISIARNFVVGIKTWPTDSNETVWNCEERIFYFYKTYVKILEREKTTNDPSQFYSIFKNQTFRIQTLYGTNIYKTKREELDKLLKIEPGD